MAYYMADYDKWAEYNNADLIGEGFPPRDRNGDPYELHHIGPQPDSPLAELTGAQHHDDGNFARLHRFEEYSEIERDEFNKECERYWMARFQDFKNCY